MISHEKVFLIYSLTKSYSETGRLLKRSRQRIHQIVNNYNRWESKWKVSIYKKYFDSCLVCGNKDNLHTHHIDNNQKNNSPENLVSLCSRHHNLTHYSTNSTCTSCGNVTKIHAKKLCLVCYLKKRYSNKEIREKHKLILKEYWQKNKNSPIKQTEEYKKWKKLYMQEYNKDYYHNNRERILAYKKTRVTKNRENWRRWYEKEKRRTFKKKMSENSIYKPMVFSKLNPYS